MTLSTPTRVFMPLNSQRTSSHNTQLCRSGKIDSVGSIVRSRSNRTAHQQNNQHDSQRNSVNRERREPALTHPIHKPRDHRPCDKKRNDESDCENNPAMRVHCERCEVSLGDCVVTWL